MNPYLIDDSILQQDLYAGIEPRTAAARPSPGRVHDAADSFVAKLQNSFEYAFAKGRAAVDIPALRDARNPAQALVAISSAVGATADALDKVLPNVLRQCFDASGGR